MLRNLAPALAAGLLLATAAVPTAAPAATVGVFSQVGIVQLRVDSVSVDAAGRYSLRVTLINLGDRAAPVAQLMPVWAHPAGRVMQGTVLPGRRDGGAAGEVVLKPTESAVMLFDLPDDPARPMLTIRAMDPEGGLREAFVSAIEDLRARATPALNTEQLDTFAGRYRTSLGTVVTFSPYNGGLTGSSFTVGGGRQDYAQSWTLTPIDKWNLAASLREPRGQAFGEMSLRAHTNKPLYGH
ncbi:MAG: hypothetical protein Q7T61_20375 [Caulobacter sp.]|nr:hypothetical protein [Caulobacter sp.]